MDKKTILAFVLITLLMAIFMNIQSKNNPKNQATNITEVVVVEEGVVGGLADSRPAVSADGSMINLPLNLPTEITDDRYIVETDLYTVEFSTYGGVIKSLQLKQFKEHNRQDVELILGNHYSNGKPAGAFLLYFAGNNSSSLPFYGPFVFKDEGDNHYTFTARASMKQDGVDIPFVLVKHFQFLPNEYMFKVDIELLQPDGNYLPLNFNGFSYTLEGIPQLGPMFDKLDGHNVYRKNSYLVDNKRKEINLKDGQFVNDERVTWAAVVEKYFAFIGMPDASQYRQTWTEKPVVVKTANGDKEILGRQLSFSRKEIKNARNTDTFYFFMGPKQENILNSYDNGNNGFGLSNLKLGKAMDEAKILYPVEWLLKRMLEIAYSWVGNWGWAILIVTLVVKLVLFPLTLKSMLSTARMGELAPKLKVLQEQYKGKPQEMQKAQMELYKKEGVNPMAGCLPILLQMPILLAMYGLFIKYFEFRGAAFFGWITDLSAPDSIFSFGSPIPLLGWDAIRLLPVIYVASQYLMNVVTQSSQTAQNDQMKMMMNIMPVMFFFILYNMPSGLLVYWIASNLFSVGQQMVINRLKNKMNLGTPVVAVGKGKGKNSKKK